MRNWIYTRLQTIKQSSLYRQIPEGKEQETYFTPATNDYLGLATDPRVKKAGQEAIERYGTGSTGSRLVTGNRTLHERLENKLADYKGYEACLLFSSGYLANLGVITALADEQTTIFSDEYNHASIIDGCRLSKAHIVVYRHNDMEDLEEKLKSYRTERKKLIITDGVFSMDGDIAPLDQLDFLAKAYDALLIVDDAHGTGVLGDSGRGTASYFQVQPDVLIGTLSKAVGSEGGFVCASRYVIDYFIQQARPFIFQTALSPANVGSALMSLHLMQTENRHRILQKKVAKVRKALQTKYTIPASEALTPIIPLLIGSNQASLQLQEALRDYRIHLPAIRPPTVPEGSSRLRCTLRSTYTDVEINRLIQALLEVRQKL